MATKKAGGSTRNGRDSNPKYLGVKKFGGEHVIAGNIIIRQRGTKVHPGKNVGMGKDHTLFAKIEAVCDLAARELEEKLQRLSQTLHPARVKG